MFVLILCEPLRLVKDISNEQVLHETDTHKTYSILKLMSYIVCYKDGRRWLPGSTKQYNNIKDEFMWTEAGFYYSRGYPVKIKDSVSGKDLKASDFERLGMHPGCQNAIMALDH